MGTILTILGGVAIFGGVIIWGAKWGFKKWMLPSIKTREHKDLALHIGNIADDVTDNLKEMFPDAKWDDLLDKGVDELIKIVEDKDIPKLHVNPQVAKRAIRASIQRKKVK